MVKETQTVLYKTKFEDLSYVRRFGRTDMRKQGDNEVCWTLLM